MIKNASFKIAALGAAFLFPDPASAEWRAYMTLAVPCGTAAEIDAVIASYGEKRFAVATDPAGAIEVRVNPKTGTYTILLTTRSGLTCVLGMGERFTATGAVIPGQDI